MPSLETATDMTLDLLIENLKADRKALLFLDFSGFANFLPQLYARLQERHRIYATDDLLADEILHLLDEEILHEKETSLIDIGVEDYRSLMP